MAEEIAGLIGYYPQRSNFFVGGVVFIRRADGSVGIRLAKEYEAEEGYSFVVDLTAEDFASVVAHMAALPADGVRFQAALDFHNEGWDGDPEHEASR